MPNVAELRIKTVSHRIGLVLAISAFCFSAGFIAIQLLVFNPRPTFSVRLPDSLVYKVFCSDGETDEICLRHQYTTPEQFEALDAAFARRQEAEKAQTWDTWHQSNWTAAMLSGVILAIGVLGYVAVRSLGWIISGAFVER